MSKPLAFVCARNGAYRMRAGRDDVDLRDVLAGREPTPRADPEERVSVTMHYGSVVRELSIARRFLTPGDFNDNAALTKVVGADGIKIWERLS